MSIGRSTSPTGEDKSVPADMLLLAGSAIVNEAILTGESTPQWKVVFLFFFFPLPEKPDFCEYFSIFCLGFFFIILFLLASKQN